MVIRGAMGCSSESFRKANNQVPSLGFLHYLVSPPSKASGPPPRIRQTYPEPAYLSPYVDPFGEDGQHYVQDSQDVELMTHQLANMRSSMPLSELLSPTEMETQDPESGMPPASILVVSHSKVFHILIVCDRARTWQRTDLIICLRGCFSLPC